MIPTRTILQPTIHKIHHILHELAENSLQKTSMRMKRKLLRECKEVIGNVRFERGIRGGTAFVLLRFFLKNLFRLFEPFLLQVCSNVSENFIFVHSSITISNSSSKPLCNSQISETQWKFVWNFSLGFSLGLFLWWDQI